MELCGIDAGQLRDDDQFAELESGGDDLFSELRQVVLVSAPGFADQPVQTHGGMGYAKEFDVERYWREARMLRLAPLTQELALNHLAVYGLGLPRSF